LFGGDQFVLNGLVDGVLPSVVPLLFVCSNFGAPLLEAGFSLAKPMDEGGQGLHGQLRVIGWLTWSSWMLSGCYSSLKFYSCCTGSLLIISQDP
jgi:hypothetical protein